MHLSQNQSQKQIITNDMRQSLEILQLPLLSLEQYIHNVVLENPLIIMNDAGTVTQEDSTVLASSYETELFHIPKVNRNSTGETAHLEVADDKTMEKTFTDYLLEQLRQDKNLPVEYLSPCVFLVESLDDRGYLGESVESLAEEMGLSVFSTLQALYVIQDLSPKGVGARDLEECLVLQIAETPDFNEYTLQIIKNCLPLLASGNTETIALKLGITPSECQRWCDAVRHLNPLPSNGFKTRQISRYIIPDAYIDCEGEHLSVRYNVSVLPKIRVDWDYYHELNAYHENGLPEYLQKNLHQAKKLQVDIENRKGTLERIIQYAAERQCSYLLGKIDAPLSLERCEVAQALGLHPSTISRAIRDKYLSVNGKTIPLKYLFSLPVIKGSVLSKSMVQQRIAYLILKEDKQFPLSDENLRSALDTLGISLSRRTVAAYRTELGIQPAAARRIKFKKFT